MQSVYKILALLLVLPTAGCDLTAPERATTCVDCNAKLEIHLNNGFDDDLVRIEVDDEAIFDARATTDYVLSLAERIELMREPGPHRIDVLVNGRYGASRVVDLDGSRYVQVRYYPEPMRFQGIMRRIVIEISTERPVYD